MKSTGFGFILKVFIFLTIPSFLLHNPVMAQPIDQGPQPAFLDLSSAIQTAVNKNHLVLAAQYQVDASAAQITQARSGFFPQLSVSETVTKTNNPMWAFGTKLNQKVIEQRDFDPDLLNEPDAINNYTTSISMNWSLFDPAQTWIPWKQSKQHFKATELSLARTRQEIIAQTVMAYNGLLLATEHLNVVQKVLETARAHLKMIQSRFDGGFIVKSDLLRAQVRVGELEQNLIQSESNLNIARAHLNVVMGVPVDDRYILSDRLDGALEINEALAIAEGTEMSDPLEKWIVTALSHRPDLAKLQYQEKMAENEVKKSKWRHLPSIHVMGNYEINSEDFEDTAENYTLGAMMQLNLFSGSRLWGKTREAKASLSSVKSMREGLESGIRVEIRQAFYQIQSAKKRIDVAKASTMQADEGLRIIKNRYENGLVTIVDLLDAQVASQQSQMNYLSALHDYKTAAARLFLAAGIIDLDFR